MAKPKFKFNFLSFCKFFLLFFIIFILTFQVIQHFKLVSTVIIYAAIYAIVISLICLTIARQFRYSRRRKRLDQQSIIAEYDPPQELSPAEVGYLFDSAFGKAEISATLVWLEQNGLISITIDSSHKIVVLKLGPTISLVLKPHEQYIIDHLKKSTPTVMGEFNENDPGLLNSEGYSINYEEGFKNSLIKSLHQQGLITDRPGFLDEIGPTLTSYLIVIMPPFILLMYLNHGDITQALGGISEGAFNRYLIYFLILALIVRTIFGKVAGEPELWTKKLKELWPHIEGYREYVRQVELDELQFESEDLMIASKNKTLPYAIALGLNTKWQKRFK